MVPSHSSGVTPRAAESSHPACTTQRGSDGCASYLSGCFEGVLFF